jgi:hypothetical protein
VQSTPDPHFRLRILTRDPGHDLGPTGFCEHVNHDWPCPRPDPRRQPACTQVSRLQGCFSMAFSRLPGSRAPRRPTGLGLLRLPFTRAVQIGEAAEIKPRKGIQTLPQRR